MNDSQPTSPAEPPPEHSARGSSGPNPLHARHYADAATALRGEVLENPQIARDTYRVRVAAPQIAASVLPGQFVMIRMADRDDPLIGRALAMYDIGLDGAGRPHWIDLVYIRKGKLTTALAAARAGAAVSLWGPLGNGFDPLPCDRLIMAAGGIGQTPFLALANEALGHRRFGSQRPSGYAGAVEFIYGARSADLFAGVEQFAATGATVHLCTDDGSAGWHGRVPDRLVRLLGETPAAQRRRVVCCGPEIMMAKVAEVAARHQVECQVSLETPMACGIGICYSCVAPVRQSDGGWDYKRTCVEGPVFDASAILWGEGDALGPSSEKEPRS